MRGKGANTVKAQQFVERRTSQQIGAAHERAVRVLLDKWGLRYVSKQRFQTTLGSVIELDFFLPGTDSRPPVVLLLLSEIGEDFHIVSVSEAEVLKRLMTGDTSAVLIPAERT